MLMSLVDAIFNASRLELGCSIVDELRLPRLKSYFCSVLCSGPTSYELFKSLYLGLLRCIKVVSGVLSGVQVSISLIARFFRSDYSRIN